MKTTTTISIALAALFSSSLAFADTEVSGKLIIEHAALTANGSTIGNRGNSAYMGDPGAGGFNQGVVVVNSGYTSLKDDISVRLYVDGDVADGVTYHAELQGFQGVGYGGDQEYTQNAGMRELYVDIDAGDGWAARLGKQQVVWGTADGMKLLDIINPTDYAEMAQNQMEDSRLPVWALNLEAGNTQVVISEPKENVFAGLNRGINTDVRRNDTTYGSDTTFGDTGTDTGNAFMMKGPDTITGQFDGFLNIAPDLGGVATMFGGAFGGPGSMSTASMQGFTVGSFEGMTMQQMAGAMALSGYGPAMNGLLSCDVAETDPTEALYCTGDYTDLPTGFATSVANTAAALGIAGNAVKGSQMLHMGFGSQFDSNLADDKTDGVNDTAFDYMSNATFMTFDAFAGVGSQYVYNMPESDDVDFAIKTSQTTKSGVNYSLNFSNSSDKNPIINMSWRDSDGVELAVNKMKTNGLNQMYVDSSATADYTLMLTDVAAADGTILANGEYGGAAMAAGNMTEFATLRFEQTVNKAKNIGGSFDTTVETAGLGPIVVRGEALYTVGSYAPVIDKDKLSYGDLVGALQMVEVDRFKFVLGADVTVLTNMLISAQYISDRNLDFVDGANRYTADFATMHMSNEFNKSIEDKQFYSLFFSKPFGSSGQNRWNNIFMSEEGIGENGYWNRFDADFGISDDVVATVEVNTYGGNENTQFGQLDKSDNMQVGVKYSF